MDELSVAGSCQREICPQTLKHRFQQLLRNTLIKTCTKNHISDPQARQHQITRSTRTVPRPTMSSFRMENLGIAASNAPNTGPYTPF
ncbi:hypothetical protein F2Q70_00022394 [Brassica cretica]|uniref:Uncharacterized protein n=1 Tax=Brassica cretica TaxID=69181 RepID=A0A8S9GZ52_BRACR|nr:hypothetical protein F2Q70_00022394 [Brassica cretica]